MRLLKVFLAVALLHATPSLFAEEGNSINPDRPGIADGSTVVGAGRFQIETGMQYEYRQSDSISDRRLFVPTLLRMGIGEKWEARIESNIYGRKKLSDQANGDTQSEGGQPISIGLKYQFRASDDTQRPSIGVILRLFPASGSGEFRTQNMTGDIRLASDWDFAPNWSLNPNIGLAIYEDDQSQLFSAQLFALTLSYNLAKTLNIFADIGVQSPEKKNGTTAIIYDAGVAYLINQDTQLDFSVGSGAAGTTVPRNFFSFGISKRL